MEDSLDLLTEEEKVISNIINSNVKSEDYSSLIRGDNRFFVQYHFNDYRSSILRWYPFDENSSVLEVGAQYGALTGALCDRCAKVTALTDTNFQAKMLELRYKNRDNLLVLSTAIEEIDLQEKYDYIVCFSKLEYVADAVNYLRLLKSLLKDKGTLLIEVENKYGIDNLCGKKDTHSGIPFDNIAGYPNRKKGRGFHRQELITDIELSGFKYHKFYYPAPDYIAPRAIYTDEYQPEQNMMERVITYDRDASSLVADSNNFFLESAVNGAFPFVANSFLVEISNESIETDVNYATLTGYRSREKSFATLIGSSDVVVKRAQYTAGIKYASDLCHKIEMLKNRGVNVLDMTLEGDSMIMKKVEAPTFQQHIIELVNAQCSREEIFSLYDLMWENIIKSSEIGGECTFDTKGIDVGPVLANAFLELIPMNSFWVDGDIMYFDQEYVKPNYPAKYVLFRCILHTYNLIKGLNEIIDRNEMYAHFDINDGMLKIFLEMEGKLGDDENPGMYFLLPCRDAGKMKKNRMMLGEA